MDCCTFMGKKLCCCCSFCDTTEEKGPTRPEIIRVYDQGSTETAAVDNNDQVPSRPPPVAPAPPPVPGRPPCTSAQDQINRAFDLEATQGNYDYVEPTSNVTAESSNGGTYARTDTGMYLDLSKGNQLEMFKFGKLDKYESTLLLKKQNHPGTFLVRDSKSKPGSFTLSVLDRTREVIHFPIQFESALYFVYQNPKFPSLETLVAHYKENRLHANVAKLTVVCPNKPAPKERVLSVSLKSLCIPKSELTFLSGKLDIGKVGEYRQGYFSRKLVAIKVLKNPAKVNRNEFFDKAERMATLKHENIVRLIAVVEDGLYLVMEHLCKVNLLKYMTEQFQTFDLRKQVSVALQVAEGMSYLQENEIIHMGVQAFNIWVGGDLFCKIANFVDPAPVRWCAPEVLAHGAASLKSDVWSYGVLLYEIATRGRTPYADKTTEGQVKDYVINGGRLSTPDGCNEHLVTLMENCWGMEADDRANFTDLKEYIYRNLQGDVIDL